MLILIFNSEQITVPIRFKKMGELPQEMIESMMKGDYKYEIQSKVSKEVFQIFYDYLVDGTEPELHIDNIFELGLLAQEFKLEEIIKSIKIKKAKLREYENFLENQTSSQSIQIFQQLDNTIRNLNNKIENLERNFINQKAEFQSIYNELKTQINNQYNELTQKYEEIENMVNSRLEELSQNVEEIRNVIQSNEAQFSTQASMNNELTNSINQINNQIESFQSQLLTQKEQLAQNESEINSKLENLKLNNDDLKNKTNEINNNYISKDIPEL